MTPDLVSTVRAALAAATQGHADKYDRCAACDLRANAPVWLAQLCDEIERLRAEAKDLFRSFPICSLAMQGGECSAEDRWKEVVAIVVAERDAADALIPNLASDRNAWRACADQLEPFVVCEYPDENGEADGRCLACASLAVYERLMLNT